jgi:hypothetical protein
MSRENDKENNSDNTRLFRPGDSSVPGEQIRSGDNLVGGLSAHSGGTGGYSRRLSDHGLLNENWKTFRKPMNAGRTRTTSTSKAKKRIYLKMEETSVFLSKLDKI